MREQGAGVVDGSGRGAAAVPENVTVTNPFHARIARDLVVVSGPDATSFLQSLVSQDLDAVAVGGTVKSLLLQPQGKLIVDFRATRVADDTWWCDCEGGFGSTLADGLNRFKIRVKVDIETPAVSTVAVRGEVAPTAPDGVRLVPAWDGVDAIGPAAAVDEFRSTLTTPEVDAAAYERARIEAGVPKLGADMNDKTIPQEAFLERDAVSFTKGCFVGQELVCRIDTRGHVNRYLRRLRSDDELIVGAPITAGDKVVGEVTSSAGDVALAMIRAEVEPGATVSVGESAATVEAI
jgi:folate-binding protein YgfZ